MNNIIAQLGILIFCFAVVLFSRTTTSIEQILFKSAAMALCIVMILSLLVIVFYRIINKTSVEKSKLLERKQGD